MARAQSLRKMRKRRAFSQQELSEKSNVCYKRLAEEKERLYEQYPQVYAAHSAVESDAESVMVGDAALTKEMVEDSP